MTNNKNSPKMNNLSFVQYEDRRPTYDNFLSHIFMTIIKIIVRTKEILFLTVDDEFICKKLYQGPGPDLDLWGPLGRLSCGGPQYMIFMEAIKLSSEASEPLRMRGPEKRPLELQLFFVSFWVSLFKHVNTICWCVRIKENCIEPRSWKQ